MSKKHSRRELTCPFTRQSVEKAFGQEVHLFLHCHLRGYDRHGDGKLPDLDYYDKYGAPVSKENSWTDGYHVVEKKLADYYNAVVDYNLDFPLIAGMGGGVHLYKPLHDDDQEPWNWTGWIPQQKKWLSQGTFFSNRYFLGIRGNEIQNNLWDYHPHDEEEGEDTHDLEYSQLEPNDRYRGGYWFPCQPFGRYLHIIALKSHAKTEETGQYRRYNYIVHPLAYRASIGTIPDNSVDAMQWCIINMPDERHFGPGKPWGDKCDGIEIFNDFTYYYSYQNIEDSGPHNGELGEDPSHPIDGDTQYYYWFDTYPLEFAVFLLDSALARGVYLQTLCANDAFYERGGNNNESKETLAADPKGSLWEYNMENRDVKNDLRLGVKALPPPKNTKAVPLDRWKFLMSRPYKMKTSFGYVSLIDPRMHLKEAVFKNEDGIPHMGLNEGETMALDYLTEGRFYSTTGIWDIFNYDFYQLLPYKIYNQADGEKLCYELTEDMELVFTFAKCQKKNEDLVWRYTIMAETAESKGLQTTHGYFKLDPEDTTKLDLRNSYDKHRVKWLYFTAIRPKNPQHRAWFSTIRGLAFGEPLFHAKIAKLHHSVYPTKKDEKDSSVIGQAASEIKPFHCKSGNLDFILGKIPEEEKENIYVYFMQVYPLQQDLSSEPINKNIKESSQYIPPRIRQSVHGYFSLQCDHPTRITLSASWDKNKVKGGKVYFYYIDGKTGEPKSLDGTCVEPKLFRNEIP